MTDFTLTYLQGMYYDPSIGFFDQWIPCEVCDQRAADVHHIEARGMGGSTHTYTIQELMGLCRECHEQYGDKKQHITILKTLHRLKLMTRRINKIMQILYPS